ncbi:S8 family peptidase [Cohnella sp. GCM10012308]|uniref:S8 family peptidase n=1 Tax=Cohnella sp. GCM10012308 TaxID=3317329 RepID=UPI00361A1F9A
MDSSALLRLLRRLLAGGGERGARTIVRFARHEDGRRFLAKLAARRSRGMALRAARPIRVIGGFSLPLRADSLIPLLSYGCVLEEDRSVKISRRALPRPFVQTDSKMDIPWGVRRIRAPQAWSRTTGQRVKVGVIDTGVDFGHPDLRHALSRGINLLQRASLPHDDNGHGTHIAGTISAANASRGMIGVAPRTEIHPVKAFDTDGSAYVSDIILGIEWCVHHGMDIVNMSFGMPNRSEALLKAVESAHRAGVLIVASSGNDGRKGRIDYPAGYGHTVAVGALDRRGRIARFTNRSAAIDIYAPGAKVESAWPNGRRRVMSGTSMATSHVTGAVALLLALRPGLSPSRIKDILRRSAKPLGYDKAPQGAGELDVLRMLEIAGESSGGTGGPPGDRSARPKVL